MARLIKNPLCVFARVCRTPNGDARRAIVGPAVRWPAGKGDFRNVWCTRCVARGVLTCNRDGLPHTFDALLIPDAKLAGVKVGPAAPHPYMRAKGQTRYA